MEQKTFFRTTLLEWARKTPRPLPWKGIEDPYRIWLSEILLQQTRAEQAIPYYEKFTSKYPTIFDLAKASLDEVIKDWEGLGYYSRARNLHHTANIIAGQYQGNFPDTYEELLELKGVGPYTAAAIASFAFQRPRAVIDGNVFRVLSRFFGIDTPADSSRGKKEFSQLAQELLPPGQPAIHNQAIMDFGAVQCTPATPNCNRCPMASLCFAHQNQQVDKLPVKSKRIQRKTRYFNYLLLEHDHNLLLQQRTAQDIWQHLYEFPQAESSDPIGLESLHTLPPLASLARTNTLRFIGKTAPLKQTLTHQLIIATFWFFEFKEPPRLEKNTYIQVRKKDLKNYAFPRVIDWFLQQNFLNLELF